MSDKIPPRFRKTKTEKWAVMAPVEDLERALAEGGKIDVQKRSGDWSSFQVGSLGKPFDVDGVQMCYGYGPDDNDQPDSSAGGSRDGRQSQTSRSTSDPSQGATNQRSRSSARSALAPVGDPSEPLPEYQGGPEDEWDGGF